MKKIYSIFALLLLAITSLTAAAATSKVTFITEPGAYALLKVFDQNINDYKVVKTFPAGTSTTLDLTNGLGYYVCAGGNHILAGVWPEGNGSDTCPIPYIKEDGALGSYAMIYIQPGMIAESYIIATEGTDIPPTPDPNEGYTNFVLEPGSAAYLRHWSMWDADGKLLEDMMTDLTFVTGDNLFELQKDITYYITPAIGETFELVVDAEGVPQTISSPDDLIPSTQYVAIPAGKASSKYTIRTTNNQQRPIEKGTRFTLAEGSHASIYTAENDNLKLVSQLAEGDNFIELDIEANPYFIVPDPGYELARVETADKTTIIPEVNTEFFPTNYVDVNENLSTAYYIETREAAGIETITSTTNSAVTFYDLNGRRAINLIPGNLYVRIAGGVATKVLVK